MLANCFKVCERRCVMSRCLAIITDQAFFVDAASSFLVEVVIFFMKTRRCLTTDRGWSAYGAFIARISQAQSRRFAPRRAVKSGRPSILRKVLYQNIGNNIKSAIKRQALNYQNDPNGQKYSFGLLGVLAKSENDPLHRLVCTGASLWYSSC